MAKSMGNMCELIVLIAAEQWNRCMVELVNELSERNCMNELNQAVQTVISVTSASDRLGADKSVIHSIVLPSESTGSGSAKEPSPTPTATCEFL